MVHVEQLGYDSVWTAAYDGDALTPLADRRTNKPPSPGTGVVRYPLAHPSHGHGSSDHGPPVEWRMMLPLSVSPQVVELVRRTLF